MRNESVPFPQNYHNDCESIISKCLLGHPHTTRRQEVVRQLITATLISDRCGNWHSYGLRPRCIWSMWVRHCCNLLNITVAERTLIHQQLRNKPKTAWHLQKHKMCRVFTVRVLQLLKWGANQPPNVIGEDIHNERGRWTCNCSIFRSAQIIIYHQQINNNILNVWDSMSFIESFY